jgi:hypothetical protein
MTKAEKLYIETGKGIEDAEQSQMFGKPCFKINGKAFTCFFQECMVFKLGGDEHDQAMQLKGARLFDPSARGRSMKEWVQLPLLHSARWPGFARAAAEYVSG